MEKWKKFGNVNISVAIDFIVDATHLSTEGENRVKKCLLCDISWWKFLENKNYTYMLVTFLKPRW